MKGSVFHWLKEPMGHWLTALHAVTPPWERASHLTIRWEPGTPVRPVQRWAIYEMVPYAHLAPYLRERFWESDHVDSFGWQWNHQQLETIGCLGTPFWILQGYHGGHPWRYTQSQAAWMRLAHHPTEPPEPGTLPYAEWDARVLHAVMQYDRLQRAEATLKNAAKGQRAADERAVREATVQMLSTTVEDAVGDAKWKIPYEDIPTAEYGYQPPDDDAAFDRYITSGVVE